VQHWSVFQNLVAGKWPREEMGLFDKTHIRWFALGDMVALLQDSHQGYGFGGHAAGRSQASAPAVECGDTLF
jgi:hypothetical protein